MEEQKQTETDQAKVDKAIADRAKIEKLKASTKEVEAQANRELRRSLELRASFYEKLAALNAGSIAVAVSVGVALLGKQTPHSAFLRSNLDWLVVIAFFLWLSLISAIRHNALFIKIAGLEAERAEDWSKWIGLINASTMQAVIGHASSQPAQMLDKIIADSLHDRIQKGAMNQHRTEQSILRARAVGAVAVWSFLIAYTLVFICVLHIWWLTR
jgi:hypothetical protein